MTLLEVQTLTSTDKDLPLKLLTKLLFERLGYVAEIAVEISAKAYAGDFKKRIYSDYDVLGTKFEPDLYRHRIAAECKSGEAKAVEEVLKLRGVLSTFGIERGYFVKTRASQTAKDLAGRAGISVLGSEELEGFLKTAYGVDPKAVVAAEFAVYSLNRGLDVRFNNEFQKAWRFLRFEYWNREPHRNLQGIIHILAGDKEKLRPDDSANRYGFLRLVFHFALSLLEMCGKVIGSGLTDPTRTFGVLFFGGPRERREREGLFDMIHQSLPPQQAMPKFEPDYMLDLDELVLRIVRSAPEAAMIPAFVQGVIDEKFANASDRVGKYSSVTRKLAQDTALFLAKAAGVQRGIAEDLLSY